MNDLSDYVRHEFTGRASTLPARATVGFWSYFVNGSPGTDVTAPTPYTPCAVSAQEAIECLRMLALERLIGRQHHPHQLIEAGLTALVLGVETESLPLLARCAAPITRAQRGSSPRYWPNSVCPRLSPTMTPMSPGRRHAGSWCAGGSG
ncbi:hypothetical protein ACFYNW_23885 [Streptomyces virginiae]|uniref:hypothetical protein n=1 Tax=Streptomyces virginiae TaxID=1961 RepID=UPI0036EFD18F